MCSSLFVHQAVDDSIQLRKDGKEDEREKKVTSKDRAGYRASTPRMVGRPHYSCIVTSGVGVWYTSQALLNSH